MKLCHYPHYRVGYSVDLPYLRDRTGREVDAQMTANRKPWLAVEVKVAETGIDLSLVYFRDRLKIPFVCQVVLQSTRDVTQDGACCMPAARLLSALI